MGGDTCIYGNTSNYGNGRMILRDDVVFIFFW